MKLRVLALVCVLILIAFAACDSRGSDSIVGVVKDENGKPIEGVKIQIENMKTSATTDKSGKYSIEYDPGDLRIHFSKRCFSEKIVRISISEKNRYPMKDITLKTKSMPWSKAIKTGDIETLQKMIECIDINENNGRTSLLGYACSNGKEDIVKMLLEKGADVNLEIGRPAIIGAAIGGNSNILEIIINKGADVNSRDERGMTALMCAARGNRTQIVKILLANGADASLKDIEGRTASEWALRHNRKSDNQEILQALDYAKNK
jgi:hypothetical protein